MFKCLRSFEEDIYSCYLDEVLLWWWLFSMLYVIWIHHLTFVTKSRCFLETWVRAMRQNLRVQVQVKLVVVSW